MSSSPQKQNGTKEGSRSPLALARGTSSLMSTKVEEHTSLLEKALGLKSVWELYTLLCKSIKL